MVAQVSGFHRKEPAENFVPVAPFLARNNSSGMSACNPTVNLTFSMGSDGGICDDY